MFEKIDDGNTRLIKRNSPEPDAYSYERDEEVHPLDERDKEDEHLLLMGYYRQELDRQYDNRLQQATDVDYYDHDQWTDEERSVLNGRGQAALVYNVISQSVNWVIGSEKRGRTDFKILPRSKEDAKPAAKKTKLMKYLSDVNRVPFNRSRAFEDCVKVGVGWLEDSIDEPEDNGEPIFNKYESWRNILWDSASTEYDLSDCRYVCRSKWLDSDILEAIFPDRAALIKESASDDLYTTTGIDRDSDEFMDSQEESLNEGYQFEAGQSSRRRVRTIEMWYKKAIRVTKIISGERLAGSIFDPENKDHVEMLNSGQIETGERMMMRVHVAIMTTKGILWQGESPFKHNRYIFTPIWGYRRDRDQMPYGLIRGMRDIQDDINKRASKALYIMSSNKIVMDEGAVNDIEELREEASDPNGIIVKKKGKELVLNADRGLENSHLEMMSRDISMIQQVSGVTDELLGRTTNAQSGVAVQSRQQQGMMSTAKLFDNLRFAVQMQGENQLSLIEQFMTEEKQFRITNDRGVSEFEDINDGLPENDIVNTKADFIVSEDEWRASLRQANVDQLMEQITRMPPEVSMVMLDLVVESMDIPNREEIVKRIRKINGQKDPEELEVSPEEQARMDAQAEQDAYNKELAMADLRDKQATAAKKEADAEKSMAGVAETKVSTEKAAMEAAQLAVETPNVVSIADKILSSSGFKSQEELDAMQQQQLVERQRQEQASLENQQAQTVNERN